MSGFGDFGQPHCVDVVGAVSVCVGQHCWHSFIAGSGGHRVWLQISISVAATHVFTANAQTGGPASRNCCPPPAGGVSAAPPGATASGGPPKPLCRFSQI